MTSHGSEANPRLCAGCHVNQFTVTDQETGDFLFQEVPKLEDEALVEMKSRGLSTTGTRDAADRAKWEDLADYLRTRMRGASIPPEVFERTMEVLERVRADEEETGG